MPTISNSVSLRLREKALFFSHEDTEAQSLKNSVNRPDNRVFKISLAEVY